MTKPAVSAADRELIEIATELIKNRYLENRHHIAAAVRVAKQLGPGHTVVTVLCDGGSRYQSKLFNPEFLRSKDLPVPGWLAG